MDETSSAPVAEATAPETQASMAVATDRVIDTRQDRLANSATKLREFLAARSEANKVDLTPKSEPESAPAVEKTVEKAVEKVEKAGAKPVEQREGESDAKYEMRLAKQYRELRQANEKASKFEGQATEMASKVAKFEKLMESGKENPLALLEHLGLTFADVVKGINEDKYKAPEKKLELPPEVAERLERLDRAEKAREEAALAESRNATRAQHENQVAAFVKENAAEYPLAYALPGTAKAIIEEAYEKGVTDITPLLAQFEESLASDMLPMLQDDGVVKALLKREPKVKAALIKALGLEAAPVAAPAPEKRAKGVGEMSTEPGTAPKKMSKEARIALALGKLKER